MATTKQLNVPEHVRNIILDQMEWDEVEGKTIGRIKLHLDRQTYLEVNKVLEALGSKWNRAKKFAGHVFDHDPRPALSPLEENGELEIDVWGFFRTPPDVVRQMLNFTEPKVHEWVLEPSAGDGAILGPLVERTGDKHRIHAVEMHEERAQKLAQDGWCVFACNFLEFDSEEAYDVILMNPPFEKKQDLRHILHAYYDCLKPGGRMAAIAAAGVKFRSDYQELKDLADEQGIIIDLPTGTFEGTGVCAVLLLLQKPTGGQKEEYKASQILEPESYKQASLF